MTEMNLNWMKLSTKNKKTLKLVFEDPTRADLDWNDFVSLYLALGGDPVKAGKTGGSRARLTLNGVRAVLHRPHPGSTMKKGSVRSAREFLFRAGVSVET